MFTRIGAIILLVIGGGLWLLAGDGGGPERHREVAGLTPPADLHNRVPPNFDLATERALFEGTVLAANDQATEPVTGPSCDVLEPHQGFVDEMLVRFGNDGSKSYERRVALVIGNGAYRGAIGRLDNPTNDAASMANVMAALGFRVYRGIDLDAEDLDACLGRFTKDLRAENTDIALFFYAGHGIQLVSETDNEKRNYMMATDARIEASGEGIGYKQIDAVLNQMRDHSEQSVFFYDACRNYPLGDQKPEIIEGVAIKRGVALVSGAAAVNMKQQQADERAGIYIAYATAPNRVADDSYERGADHSPFTRALLNNIATPGYSLKQVMSYVSNDVGELTDWNQTPWTSSSLTEDMRLNGNIQFTEIKYRSRDFVAESKGFRENGLKSRAVASALKGKSRWKQGKSAGELAPADAELSLAVNSTDVRLIGHEQNIGRARFFNRNTRVLTVSEEGTARIWSVKSGEEIWRISALGTHNYSASIDAVSKTDQRFIVLGDEGGVLLYDTKSLKEVAAIEKGKRIKCARFSADSRMLVVCSGFGFSVWNAQNGAFIKRFEGHEEEGDANHNRIISAAFHPTKDQIVSASRKSIRLWNFQSGRELKRFVTALGNENDNVTFSPKGSFLIINKYDGTYIERMNSAAVGTTFTAEDGKPFLRVRFSKDEKRVLLVGREVSTLTNLSTGETVREYERKEGYPRFAANDSLVVTSGGSPRTQIWDPTSGKKIAESDLVYRAVSTDGTVLAVGGWSRHRIDLMPLKPAAGTTFQHPHARSSARITFHDSAFLSNRIVILASSDKDDREKRTARLWNFNTGNATRSFPTACDELKHCKVRKAIISRSGRHLVTLTSTGIAQIWDVSSGAELHRKQHGEIKSIALSNDGRFVATGSNDETARVWDLTTGRQIISLSHKQELPSRGKGYTQVNEIAFSPDANLMATVGTHRADELAPAPFIWNFNLKTGELINKSSECGPWYLKQSVSQNHVLAVKCDWANDATVLVDMLTGEHIRVFEKYVAYEGGLSPTEDRIVLGNIRQGGVQFPSGRFAMIADVKSGLPLQFMGTNRHTATHTVFSPDGTGVLIASEDGTVRLWPTPTGDALIEEAYALLSDKLRAEVERERIRYWEVDPAVLQ